MEEGATSNYSGEKEKKTKERKMTHMLQSTLMESINNVTFPTLLSRVARLSILNMGRN